MTSRLPVFPLGTVLFPGLVLPLHIFEERYRDLVKHLLSRPDGDPREFGVVAIQQGWETLPTAPPPGQSPTDPPRLGPVPVHPLPPPPAAAPASPGDVALHEVGCTAELRQVTELPDGRYDIVTVGRRRFRVVSIDKTSEPYLMAEVEWLPEPPGQEELADLLAPRVLAVFRQYLTLIRADEQELTEQLPEDPTVLSHLVAATAALSLEDRQRLLATPDTAGRLRAELRMLTREAALLRQVRAVPVPLRELAVPASPN
ncbi:LON peptidase substrate-binding domain-containing protein [Asanoa sp. WMMD1127]|uniref:LON peptidase substrate-binding domain-containing protein n=1 Tax=Asanoa sp. WMMD1127 TaxID=3016107 RepID=UPI002417A86B|nr:LON peptidase substrate-binding domain-containing protein [Asanoa sp. WMMD1127]MDG4827054.1 LON peptidase substrate-binding domain-containing protein [Asanoa sp. WMMD1127]